MNIREFGEKAEQYFLEIIHETRHDLAGNVVKGILFLASRRLCRYRRGVGNRNEIYH